MVGITSRMQLRNPRWVFGMIILLSIIIVFILAWVFPPTSRILIIGSVGLTIGYGVVFYVFGIFRRLLFGTPLIKMIDEDHLPTVMGWVVSSTIIAIILGGVALTIYLEGWDYRLLLVCMLGIVWSFVWTDRELAKWINLSPKDCNDSAITDRRNAKALFENVLRLVDFPTAIGFLLLSMLILLTSLFTLSRLGPTIEPFVHGAIAFQAIVFTLSFALFLILDKPIERDY